MLPCNREGRSQVDSIMSCFNFEYPRHCIKGMRRNRTKFCSPTSTANSSTFTVWDFRLPLGRVPCKKKPYGGMLGDSSVERRKLLVICGMDRESADFHHSFPPSVAVLPASFWLLLGRIPSAWVGLLLLGRLQLDMLLSMKHNAASEYSVQQYHSLCSCDCEVCVCCSVSDVTTVHADCDVATLSRRAGLYLELQCLPHKQRVGCSRSLIQATKHYELCEKTKSRLMQCATDRDIHTLSVRAYDSIIYRALHHSIERAYHQHHESQFERSFRVALATMGRSRGSILTSGTFACAVSNSLNRSTQRECLPIDSYLIEHFSTMNLTTSRFSMQGLRSFCDISLEGFTCKLGSSRTVMIRSSCNGTVSGCEY